MDQGVDLGAVARRKETERKKRIPKHTAIRFLRYTFLRRETAYK